MENDGVDDGLQVRGSDNVVPFKWKMAVGLF